MNVFRNLQNDKFINTILQKMLAVFFLYQISNYMNGKNRMGGAFGFTMDSIDKIYDMKMKSNGQSLLSVLI